MQSFIAQLKKQLSEADWTQVVSALRSEPQLWDRLQDEDFARKALDLSGSDTARWSPGFLGLLSLDQSAHFGRLAAAPMEDVDEELRYQAASAFESLAADGVEAAQQAPGLEQATWLALALRERYRRKEDWHSLISDLEIAAPDFWRLPLAILFGLLPDPQELLVSLLDAGNPTEFRSLGLHALMSQPLSEEEQLQMLVACAEGQSLAQWLGTLRILAGQRPSVAQALAAKALSEMPEKKTKGQDLDQVAELLLSAELHQLSGHHEKAVPLLSQAWESAQRFQAGLAAKLANSAARNNDQVTAMAALEQAALLSPADSEMKAELLAKQLESGQLDPKQLHGKNGSHPASLIAAAQVALKEGDTEEAQNMAHSALAAAGKGKLPEFAQDSLALLLRLAELLLDLNLPADARRAAQLAQERSPNSGVAAFLLSRAEALIGSPQAALEAAHLAMALEPGNKSILRHLAKRLMAEGQADEALANWEKVIDGENGASADDRLDMAEAAYMAGEHSRTINICKDLFEEQPENGRAHALVGQAMLAAGKADKAIIHLRLANEFAPEDSGAWLALAAYHREADDLTIAIETLKDALHSAADKGQIHAELGSIYRQQEKSDLALSAYRQAAQGEQMPASLAQDVALAIAEIELELGLVNEARQDLAAAHQVYPANIAIAQLYGQTLLDLGEAASALTVFKQARQSQPENIDLQLGTARAHLAAEQDIEQAVEILKAVLAEDKGNLEARALLAEAQSELGDYAAASKSFAAAMKAAPEDDNAWKKRLVLGKAKSELAAGNSQLAISALEALRKELSDDHDVARALCHGYQQDGRAKEAFQIAQQIYLSGDKSEDKLLWYAEQAQALDKAPEAIKELKKSVAEDSLSPALTLRLGQLNWTAGDEKAAKSYFSKLLKDKQAHAENLADAGRFLLAKGKAKKAISFLERAIASEQDFNLALNQELAVAQQTGGNYSAAVEILDQCLVEAPNNPRLLAKKAELYHLMDRPQAALKSLEDALEMLPQDAELLASKARLLAERGDWAPALQAAEMAVKQNPREAEFLRFAAELAAASLQPQRGRALLADIQSPEAALASLDAELALDLEEELLAAKALAPALESAAENARVHALQARLSVRRGDYLAAEGHLHRALKSVGAFSEEDQHTSDYVLTLIGVGLAAKEMLDWDSAVKLLTKSAEAEPDQARANFILAKTLIERAEWQQICVESAVVGRAAGEDALSKDAQKRTLQALKAAHKQAPFADARAMLKRWELRAALRFAPRKKVEQFPEAFPSNVAEAAALHYAARQRGDVVAADHTLDFEDAAAVKAEMALSITTGDPHRAFVLASEAAELLPHPPIYNGLAARLALAAGKPMEALELINRALTLWPEEARWHALAAQIQAALGDHTASLVHYEQASALEPGYEAHHFAFGRALMTSGKAHQAVVALEQAHELNPDSADVLIHLAQAQRANLQLDDARKSAAAASKAAPANIDALVLQADLALQAEQADKARNFAEKALEVDAKSVEAMRIQAESLAAQGRNEEAVKVLELAQKDAGDKVPLQVRRAQLLPKSREPQSDLHTLQQLSQRYPQRPEVFLALSEALATVEDYKQALDAAQQALKFSEQLPAADKARLHLHLGEMLKHRGQLDQALHHLDEAVHLTPYLVEAHLQRAQVFLARRQHQQALTALEEAARVAPNDARPHYEAAMALKSAKDYAAAEDELRAAAQLDPKNHSIQRQLAAVIALNLVHQPEELGAKL